MASPSPRVAREWAHSDVEAVVDVGLTTTGGHVWAAARRLASFLERSGGPYLCLDDSGAGSHDGRPLKLLELGAGCGWLGLTVARNCPPSQVGEVCLTEREAGGGVAHLQRNVDHNVSRLGPGAFQARVTVASLDWAAYGENGGPQSVEDHRVAPGGESQQTEGIHRGWDVVLGSDLVFNEACVYLLPRVLRATLRAGARYALYAHTRYRFEILDRDFLKELEAAGLRCVEVDRDPTRPASPPAFTSVFEDEFVVLYKITLLE